jgi:CDC-like kinase
VVKIVRKIPDYYDLAKLEVDILEKLNRLDPDGKSRCIRMLDWFDYHGHLCIVFNRLGHSVYEFLKRNCYRPFSVDQVQQIAYQLCEAIKFCHDHQLTHTDLKPENVLLVDSSFDLCIDPAARTARTRCGEYRNVRCTDIQVIDFGSATFEDDVHSKIIGTRQYRAPEVILEIGWSYPSDVWSIGCIIFELYTGRTLFETHDSVEHLAIMERVLGPLPHSLVSKTRKLRYFRDGALVWNSHSPAGHTVSRRFKPLKSHLRSGSTKDRQLIDLVSQMLRYKPSERITLADALHHPLFDSLRTDHRH